MAQEYKLVDPFVSLPEPPQGEHRQLDPNIARWFRHSKALLAGATIDDRLGAQLYSSGDLAFRQHAGSS